jgi:4a-hydroxytetrahydrobiopterin dehydratase
MDKPKILTRKELRAIMPRLAGWKLAQNKLSRTFEFQDFVQSLSFVNSLVAYFETIDHHPDVYIAYGEVTFELTLSFAKTRSDEPFVDVDQLELVNRGERWPLRDE